MPRQDSLYMFDVQEYVDFLIDLKGGKSQVVVGGIIGDAEPVEVTTKVTETGQTSFTLTPSCTSTSGNAVPAVRLQAFLESYQERSTVTTICNEDLSDALTGIAQLLANLLGSP